ncbi:MAG: hydrolase [bacterium]|nr:hydrolase [bacterium]
MNESQVSIFNRIIDPLMEHPDVQRLRFYTHHRTKDRLTHSIEVAWYSYRIAAFFGLETEAVVRGSLLHDLFWYNWLREGPIFHCFRHPAISLKNAAERFDLSPKEKDIIKKHMWPLTPALPRYRESWIVSLVDTVVSLFDYIPVFKPRIPRLYSVRDLV